MQLIDAQYDNNIDELILVGMGYYCFCSDTLLLPLR